MKEILHQAHRGVSTDCPENTMSAYRAAVEQGYDLIELDPKITKDGVCVMLHNQTVNRTGRRRDGKPLPEDCRVDEMTLSELRELEFGSWFAPAFTGEDIPTLADVLAFCKVNAMSIKIDNVIESFTTEQQDMIFSMIREADLGGLVGVTGAHEAFLRRSAEALPRCGIHYDGPVTEEILKKLKSGLKDNALYVWMRFDNAATSWNKNAPVDRASAVMVKKYGRLGVWLLSEPEERDRVVREFGADVLETNGELKP